MNRVKLLWVVPAGVALVGMGVASAAVGGIPGPPTTSTTTSTTGATTTTAPTTTVPGGTTTTTTTTTLPGGTTTTTTTPLGAAPTAAGAPRSTEGCDGDYKNHGQFVKHVAQNPDRQPGDVPAAAHALCGKPLTAVGAPDDDEAVTTTTAAPPTTLAASSTPGNGKGKGRTK